MRYNLYPVYLSLQGRKCLVVGGGKVAERKVKSLLECAANVWVVSPFLTEGLSKLIEENQTVEFSRKVINHREHGEHRVSQSFLPFLCVPLCPLWAKKWG